MSLHEGSWEQRKFYTIEIYDQDSKEITQKFVDFLSRNNVISGIAVDNAEKIYRSKQKQSLIRETLPKAWNKIIGEPNQVLIELIAETTEKLCGYKPEYNSVGNFIVSNVKKIDLETDKNGVKLPRGMNFINGSYSNKIIRSFIFKGKKYDVKTWKGMLLQICKIMSDTHTDRFGQVLNLKGRKRPILQKIPMN